MINAKDIENKVSQQVFGKPLIMNVMRSYVAEAIICEALGGRWSWCSGDYAAWDIESQDGVRIEVKQSAAKQTWQSKKSSIPAFDIRPRKGRYDGPNWVAESGRNADVYIFAWHSVIDETANHKEPSQWLFFIVPTEELPDQNSIGLSALESLVSPVSYEQLADAVGSVVGALDRVAFRK
ncbi:hypothetical protein G7A66_03315 [Altererythrobacter sp. SALINAS58]|uniref:hypothetical protein n=1 Tax=Alteripontixanthobacter muriae TaxID=2705546 RepID=UPI001576D12C|nr:hypothetical protein [Alteripontixanthobacter muriae]NTZ42137.1 hypothetical protein [Alteripontixanthobacter muriae]